jgi:glycine cleavage system H protein
MTVLEDLMYTREHEWIRMEGTSARIGITDYAQDHLGDVVFIELPTVGGRLDAGATLASLESVKAVSEVFMPFAGVVLAVNTTLESHPELLNEDPYASWIARVAFEERPDGAAVMDAGAYRALCAEGVR